MSEPVSANMIFERGGEPMAVVHLVTGGHPDRWLPMLAQWRVSEPPPTPPRKTPPTGKRNPDAPARDHRWPETALAEVLRVLVPTGPNVDVSEDGVVRGYLLDRARGAACDWSITILDYPAMVLISDRDGNEPIDWSRRAPAWGWLRQHAQETGDSELLERATAEEMLAALADQ